MSLVAMPRAGPRFISLQVNKACNLRCGHCDFWTRDDKDADHYLARARQDEIIEEFSEMMSPGGAVVICGGEPMLNLDGYFGITRAARRSGVRTLSVVNGTRIRSAQMADRMIAEGPDEISISFNAHEAGLHDETRGVKGAFDKAVRALRLLLEARARQPGTTTRIYIMGLIFDRNYRDLEAFYDLALNDIGVDKLKLNFLQPSFGHDRDGDRFFAEHVRIDPDELTALIERCDTRFGLGLNSAWLAQVGMYFRSIAAYPDLMDGWGSEARTQDHICNSYDRNIMVDHYGMARLCFSPGFPGAQLDRFGDLRRFWETRHDIRDAMSQCNALCGISHSVRRETSTVVSRSATQALAKPALPPKKLAWLGALINGS
jgi:MoaA/NifB/PqqE/SkfB family radical SAM enzyme